MTEHVACTDKIIKIVVVDSSKYVSFNLIYFNGMNFI